MPVPSGFSQRFYDDERKIGGELGPALLLQGITQALAGISAAVAVGGESGTLSG